MIAPRRPGARAVRLNGGCGLTGRDTTQESTSASVAATVRDRHGCGDELSVIQQEPFRRRKAHGGALDPTRTVTTDWRASATKASSSRRVMAIRRSSASEAMPF